MAEPFIGEIRVFPYNFVPRGWAQCDGQLLPVAQNTALFSILGTTYGGDGKSTFALPNLQGSAPMGWGHGPGLTNRTLGETGGAGIFTLTEAQMPGHTHAIAANSRAGNSGSPAGNVLAASFGASIYSSAAPDSDMAAGSLADSGGSQPVDNMQPYLPVQFCIALQGIYPSRS